MIKEHCKVTFESSCGQKIIMNFDHDEQDNLDYGITFDPKVDGRTRLSLAGLLCNVFCEALQKKYGTKD
jgi:hypothetical protein